MAGVDSGIKVETQCCADIAALEARKRAFIIMQIGKPEGSKIEKVLTKFQMTNEEVEAAMAAGEVTCGEATLKLEKNVKIEESDKWCVFRTCIVTFPIAYGACYVEFNSKDGRPTDKLAYIQWNPDAASIKDKMKYSSTKVLNKFTSSPQKHQANDKDDVSYTDIVSVVKK
jgi:hypothetical protein